MPTQARLLSVTQLASVQQVRRGTTGFLFDVGTLNNFEQQILNLVAYLHPQIKTAKH